MSRMAVSLGPRTRIVDRVRVALEFVKVGDEPRSLTTEVESGRSEMVEDKSIAIAHAQHCLGRYDIRS